MWAFLRRFSLSIRVKLYLTSSQEKIKSGLLLVTVSYSRLVWVKYAIFDTAKTVTRARVWLPRWQRKHTKHALERRRKKRNLPVSRANNADFLRRCHCGRGMRYANEQPVEVTLNAAARNLQWSYATQRAAGWLHACLIGPAEGETMCPPSRGLVTHSSSWLEVSRLKVMRAKVPVWHWQLIASTIKHNDIVTLA